MKKDIFQKEFTVKGENFLFYIQANNEINFGHYRYDPYAWDVTSTGFTGVLKDFEYGLAVFKRAGSILTRWVFETRPHYFKFSGGDSEKRARVYLKFAKRLEMKIKYLLVADKATFHYYRI